MYARKDWMASLRMLFLCLRLDRNTCQPQIAVFETQNIRIHVRILKRCQDLKNWQTVFSSRGQGLLNSV